MISLEVTKDYGENELRDMVKINPDKLIGILKNKQTKPSVLTFAAEIAGILDTEEVRDVLKQLMSHKSSLVREGCLYGMQLCMTPDLLSFLQRHVRKETSEAMIGLINEMIEDYQNAYINDEESK